MTRIAGVNIRRIATLICASLLSLMLTSCGGEDREFIYLFVINGYAGAESLDLYGPTGPLVQGLKFGERSTEALEIDRATGTDFTLIIDNAPQSISLEFELFDLYPQETGTIFVKKRSDDASAAVSLYRHVQTIDPACAITFENGLSTGNAYSSTSFSFAPEFKLPDAVGQNFYADEEQVPVITECGPLPTPTESPIPRTQLYQTIIADPSNDDDGDPWYFIVSCQSETLKNGVCPVWGELQVDEQIIGHPPTIEYYECVKGAITIKQPEGAEPAPFPPADAQAQCPDGPLTWADVQVDPDAVAQCKALREYDTEILRPGTAQQTYTLFWGVNKRINLGPELFSDACDVTFRIRTPGLQTIFGPDANDNGCDDEGFHGCGDFITSNVQIPVGAEHFYVLFGRPVNPLIWQWNSNENFVDLRPYPYLNGQNERIGDTDSSPK